MTLFPFLSDIDNKRVLIVGGGETAKRKLSKLLLFTKNITVVAKETDISAVPVKKRGFDYSDLDDADIVICATDDKFLNKNIASVCKAKNIPVNAVDSPGDSTFIFPAVIKKGDLVVTVSTNGKAPIFSGYIKNKIENVLPKNTGDALNELSSYRQELLSSKTEKDEIKELLIRRIEELFS